MHKAVCFADIRVFRHLFSAMNTVWEIAHTGLTSTVAGQFVQIASELTRLRVCVVKQSYVEAIERL